MGENPDDLDLERMLGSELHIPEPGSGLRESVLLRTARLVEVRARRRRWARRGIAGVAAALLFASGFASARLLDEEQGPGGPQVALPSRDGSSAPPGVPEEIRRQVPLAPAAERRDMLLRAGDAYMARGDLQGALECYKQVMELDGAAPRSSAETADAWILAALRRESENRRRS